MAHWAELDSSNIVLRVLVGNNDDPNEGYDWIVENLGGRWERTSYLAYGGKQRDPQTGEVINEPGFRMNFAGIGYLFDPVRDAFIPPKPEPLNPDGYWSLNNDTCLWEWVEVQ